VDGESRGEGWIKGTRETVGRAERVRREKERGGGGESKELWVHFFDGWRMSLVHWGLPRKGNQEEVKGKKDKRRIGAAWKATGPASRIDPRAVGLSCGRHA